MQIGLSWNRMSRKFKDRFNKMGKWGHLEGSLEMNELAAEIVKDIEFVLLCRQHLEDVSYDLPELKRNIIQGSTLSDIGKGGPENATEEQSEFIVRIFQVTDKVEEPNKITLSEFIFRYLTNFKTPEERARILESLGIYKVSGNMSMREFYNLHTSWSLGVLNKEEPKLISGEVKRRVARHHRLEGVEIIEGELTIEDKVVIMLDKYQACISRGHKTHKETMEYLVNKIKEGGFTDDKEFQKLLSIFEKHALYIEANKRTKQREAVA